VNVNKETLTRIARLLGIAADEFAAFSDAENDVEMLETAGTSVMISNAAPKERAAASYAAQQPHGLGVVEGLRSLPCCDVSTIRNVRIGVLLSYSY
jgi:hydroxymethylpyrimidine pyrophosphatase-like HAD family hydrolase